MMNPVYRNMDIGVLDMPERIYMINALNSIILSSVAWILPEEASRSFFIDKISDSRLIALIEELFLIGHWLRKHWLTATMMFWIFYVIANKECKHCRKRRALWFVVYNFRSWLNNGTGVMAFTDHQIHGQQPYVYIFERFNERAV